MSNNNAGPNVGGGGDNSSANEAAVASLLLALPPQPLPPQSLPPPPVPRPTIAPSHNLPPPPPPPPSYSGQPHAHGGARDRGSYNTLNSLLSHIYNIVCAHFLDDRWQDRDKRPRY